MPRMTHSEKGTSSESAAFNKTRSSPCHWPKEVISIYSQLLMQGGERVHVYGGKQGVASKRSRVGHEENQACRLYC